MPDVRPAIERPMNDPNRNLDRNPDGSPDGKPAHSQDPSGPPRLDASLPLDEGLRCAILGQIEIAEDAAARIPLSNESSDRAMRVRRCRKAIKRARAVLRLLRRHADRGAVDRIDADLREAGRRLSSQRDRDVRLQTIARLLGRNASEDAASSARVERPDAFEETDRAAEVVQARMRDLEDRVGELPISTIPWSWLRRRVATRWRRIRRRLRREVARGGDERLHAVRKACGRLEAQLMLFEGIGDRRVRRRRKRISRVYETIGEDRDLALALSTLGVGEADDELRAAIERRRGELSEELERRIARLRRHPRRSWSMLAPTKSSKRPSAPDSGDSLP
jgi:hypothetical protein